MEPHYGLSQDPVTFEPYIKRFKRIFTVHTLVFLPSYDGREELPQNKIIIPSSTLEQLIDRLDNSADQPYIFELTQLSEVTRLSAESRDYENQIKKKICTVQRFEAITKDIVYVSPLMMIELGLEEGEKVILEAVYPEKGTYIKVQPHRHAFTFIEDVRHVLEQNLRSHQVLQLGQTIPVNYFDQVFMIDIIETKPSNVILISETDLNVDFEQALDYVEPEPEPVPVSKPVKESSSSSSSGSSSDSDDEPVFVPFSGKGYRLGS